MRVEVYRQDFTVNMKSLEAAGPRAIAEFFRIAVAGCAPHLKKFEDIASAQGLEYRTRAEVLSVDETPYDNRALVSIYFEVEDETKGVYFKMSIEPTIVPRKQ